MAAAAGAEAVAGAAAADAADRCHASNRVSQMIRRTEIEMIKLTRKSVIAVLSLGLGSALAAEQAAMHYPSPAEAVSALIAALDKDDDDAAVLAVLGSEAQDLVESGDDVADRAAAERFVARYREAHAIVPDGETRAELQVGDDEWPFPIPLVKDESGWKFDTAAGEQEIIDRRIGQNELSTIQVCLAINDAQREYYLLNPDGGGLLHYARRILSEPGKRNGLYWPTDEGEEPSPLGPLVARARDEGYEGDQTKRHRPYHGYFYRLLTRQGPDAPGGAYDYEAKGELIGGFAVLAEPADYGSSGIMTFMVSHDGIVFQKDLGQETKAEAAKITEFNPDSSWERVDADPSGDAAAEGDSGS